MRCTTSLSAIVALTCALGTSSATAGWDDWKKKLESALDKDSSSESSPPAETNTASEQAPSGETDSSMFSSLQLDGGMREALKVGAQRAVASLGQEDGFLGNPKLRLPLPEKLESAAKLMNKLGQEERVDEFVTTLNRAAENAVPKALPILEKAVTSLGWDDVRAIFEGNSDAATQYLRSCCTQDLLAAFQPVVAEATREAGVSGAYQALADRAGSLTGGYGLPDIDSYVTEEAVGGLFETLAEEEGKIRENPTARTTDLLKEIFK